MRIGEVAARAGLSVATVRLYERRGLMRRARRSEAGYRHYEPIDLDILALLDSAPRVKLQDRPALKELRS